MAEASVQKDTKGKLQTDKLDSEAISRKYGVSKEVVDEYCSKFSIHSEAELLDRFVANNYHKLSPKGPTGQIFSTLNPFKKRRSIIEDMSETRDKEERCRYAIQFEGAMLAELVCARAGAESKIPAVIDALSERKNLPTVDPKSGKHGNEKLRALNAIGLAYDGVEQVGAAAPEPLEYPVKKQYMKETVDVLAAALFDGSKLRKDKDLELHLAAGMCALHSGYVDYLNGLVNKGGIEKTGMLKKIYDASLAEFESNHSALDDCVKNGFIEKYDQKSYTVDALYARTYSQTYSTYYLLKNNAEPGKEKAFLAAMGPSSDAEISKKAGALASVGFLLNFENRYFGFLKKDEQRSFCLCKSTYEKRLTEIMASSSFKENVEFTALLLKSTAKGEEAYAAWKKARKKAGESCEYGDYLQETIRKRWADKVAPAQLSTLALDSKDKEAYAQLVFDKGFTLEDISVARAMGFDLAKILGIYKNLEKGPEYQALVAKGKELGLNAQYQELLAKTLLPHLVLVKLGEESREGEKAVDLKSIIGSISAASIKNSADELKKTRGFEDISDDKKQMLIWNQRVMLFLEAASGKLLVTYRVSETIELPAIKFEAASMPMGETKGLRMGEEELPLPPRAAAEITMQKGGGYYVTLESLYSPKEVAYYAIESWYLQSKVGDPAKLGSVYFGVPRKGVSEEYLARLNKRFTQGYDYFLQ
ncbi:MAG: hypothetical protein PHS02_02020, partial [Candidatus ainarchaeum sp.]|nr:hypothetical protein [Candidatus ainarchaeum sp.]